MMTGFRRAIIMTLLLCHLPVLAQAPETVAQVQAALETLDATDLDPATKGYLHMVDMATLQVAEGGEGYTRYTFMPRVKDLEKARDQLEGSLQLNLSTGQIDRLSIHNTEPLKPAFSVTVDTYRLVLTFGEEQGEQLISTLESHAAGKAGFLKSFDANVDIAFRDFRRAAP